MSAPTHDEPTELSRDILSALDGVSGVHPGYRPVHAKGVMLDGVFTPTAEAARLTKAPHANRSSTPVTVRFSNAAGVPSIADNDPNGAGPRGVAVRFHLGEHEHTDIVAHSVNGFPVRTGEEFVELLRAVAATKAEVPDASLIQAFLASHEAARNYLGAPKPFPVSFASDSYYAVTAFQFTNADGVSCFGRFRIVPDSGNEFLTDDEAALKGPNYLGEELAERLARGAIRLRVLVQIAESGDSVDDATVVWPEGRRQVELGIISLTALASNEEPEHRRIIFDPIPRVDGIDPSGDPLTLARSGVYLLSGRRRRAAGESPDAAHRSAAGEV